VTGGTVKKMSTDQARADTVAALSLICLDQCKRDTRMVECVAALKSAARV
jgi:hypothetical protein